MPPDTSPLPESSFYILLSLVNEPRHGYAILKDVEEMSAGAMTLSVSTLYTALGRLQEQGLIERSDDDENDHGPGLPRKVYRLTQGGEGALDGAALRLKALLRAYQHRLGVESV
jgi:PadR family transcriptional regulator, regulatory protein PadR